MELPVRCVNKLDDEPQPRGFVWMEDNLGEQELECSGSMLAVAEAGCECARGACGTDCACRADNPLLGADTLTPDGRLVPLVHGIDFEADQWLQECGPACSCDGEACPASITSQPPARGLHLEKLAGKGWGVVADQPIARGQFVCCYAGEYVTTPEAQRRLAEYDAQGVGHALVVLRQWLPSRQAVLRVNLDGTAKGNLARFLNHSCDGGNLRLVVVQRAGAVLPCLAFFASDDILPQTELTWAYGAPNAGPGRPCACRTAACKGFMPHDEV